MSVADLPATGWPTGRGGCRLSTRRRVLGTLVVLGLAVGACSDDPEPALQPVPGSMQIEITGAFARVAGEDLEIYFSISNYGAADRLIRVGSSVGGDVRFLADGTCSNDSVDVAPTGHIDVPASSVVVLRPGGCRTVIDGGALAAGAATTIELTLAFEGSLVFETPVTIKRG